MEGPLYFTCLLMNIYIQANVFPEDDHCPGTISLFLFFPSHYLSIFELSHLTSQLNTQHKLANIPRRRLGPFFSGVPNNLRIQLPYNLRDIRDPFPDLPIHLAILLLFASSRNSLNHTPQLNNLKPGPAAMQIDNKRTTPIRAVRAVRINKPFILHLLREVAPKKTGRRVHGNWDLPWCRSRLPERLDPPVGGHCAA
ncbi:hypothetical protein BJX68DRAFT_249357 [Aspergillus pseudodeflectus]|uniref:Uncharacterized protein n=1 Tax=Aspergillus pseudodeflectus TaxID=176178 RepID=A0ABR4JEE9_9EURO